jgi:formate dehydrogenase subunit delta
MNIPNLIHMANRIGDFFQSMPDHDEALDGIASHIRRFWDPRMRRSLLRAIDDGSASDLKPLVLQAIQKHRPQLIAQAA